MNLAFDKQLPWCKIIFKAGYYMYKGRIWVILIIFVISASLSACSVFSPKIHLVDAKMATAVDQDLMPVKVTDSFPKGSSKVCCWIKWRDAKINTQILASWHYLTDDIHILDYSFNIPKRDGSGGIALTMPDGRSLPSGSYKVDLSSGKSILRSLKFTVE